MAAEGWKNFAHIVEIDKSSVNDAIVETDAARSPVYDLQGRRLSGEPTKCTSRTEGNMRNRESPSHRAGTGPAPTLGGIPAT